MHIHEPIRITGERSVPLLTGFAIFCTLVNSFSGLKGRGRKREIRHVRRVSVARDEVQDRRGWPRVLLVGVGS